VHGALLHFAAAPVGRELGGAAGGHLLVHPVLEYTSVPLNRFFEETEDGMIVQGFRLQYDWFWMAFGRKYSAPFAGEGGSERSERGMHPPGSLRSPTPFTT